jgi:hydroxyethylthiazole kinase-like uncharacterized protein yjeF
MRPIITPAESNRLDMASAEPVAVLMERAGLGVALAAVEMGVGYGSRVSILTGRGNNGGDGYVAARYLAGRGVAVTVHSLGFPKGDHAPARKEAHAAVRAGVRVETLGSPVASDLVIDALFGVGFHGELPESIVPWTRVDTPVLAVDVPSGLDATAGTVDGAAFTARRTVTFHALKTGHVLGEGPDRSGEISVVDIGLSVERPELLLCEEDDAPRPVRERTAHKWSAGSVLVVGGSPGLTGAAMLAARAALHAGAGAAAIAAPGELQPIYAALSAGVMSFPVGDGVRFTETDITAVLNRADRYDVMVLGPGLGPVPEGFVSGLVAGWDGGLLLDADGLNALSGVDALVARTAPTVLTPHPGEFRRLTGSGPTYEAASALSATTGDVVLLKGSPTFVVGPDRWVVTTGGPELATIGTGDVLSGAIGAYWAGGLDAATAARSGAFWHGIAGKRLAERRTVTAEGLALEIGSAERAANRHRRSTDQPWS